MSFDLICYLNFGYPTIEQGINFADLYVKSGCNAIQIDIPSKDPYLENDMIKERMAYCLKHEPDYERYFDGIKEIRRRHPEIKLIFMIYENTIEELGINTIISFCGKTDIREITYVGLKRDDFKRELIAAKIGVACYVQRKLLPEEVEVARQNNGIVLLQAKTAPNDVLMPGYETFANCIRYLRSNNISNLIYASVGIQSPEDVAAVKRAGANGAFVGSTIIKTLYDEGLLVKTISEFKEAAL